MQRFVHLAAMAAAGAMVVAGTPAAHAADPAAPVLLGRGSTTDTLSYRPLEHTSRGTVFVTSSGGAQLVSDDGTTATFVLAHDYHTSACTDLFISEPPLTTDPLTWTDVVTGKSGQGTVHSGRFFLGAAPDGWLETVLDETSTPAVTEVHRIVAATGADTLIAQVTDPSDPTSAPSLSERGYVCDAGGYAVTAYGSGQTSLLLGTFSELTTGSSGYRTLASVSDPAEDLDPLAVSGDSAVYQIEDYDSSARNTTVRRQAGHGAVTVHSGGFATAAGIDGGSTAYSIVEPATGLATLYLRAGGGEEVRPAQPTTWQPRLIWPVGTAFELASAGTSGGGLYAVTAGSASPVWPGGADPPSRAAYVPLAPVRLLDTRTGTGGRTGPVAGRHSVDLPVTGVPGIPTAGVAAVVLNVTVTAPSAGGYVTVYPEGVARPTASNLNYATGQTIANQVIAGVGTGGKVELYTSSTTQLIADVAGYYPTGGGYAAPPAPSRIVDTRSGLGAPEAPIGSRHTLAVQVAAEAGVPADAAAVVLNVTATRSTSGGYLTVFPAGAGRPTASNVNYTKGQTIAGLVLARLGTGGQVDVYAYGSTDVVVDVQGWIAPGTGYVPMAAPSRFLDTRNGTGDHLGAVPGGHAITLQMTGRGGIPAGGVGAVMLNVTATGSTRGGYATVYPSGTSRPTASNLNYAAGATIANSVVAKLGPDGAVSIFVNTTTDLVVDVSGYWAS